MKLIFLYGPPAVGKLTIAKILKQKIGYKLLHNHLLQNPISEIFSYENPANYLLVREFRLRIFEEAAKSGINLIATFGIAGNKPFGHIENAISTVESKGGKVYLVQLTAPKKTLLQRVDDQSRKEHSKNLSKQKLEELIQKNSDIFDSYPKCEHLMIDTEVDTPEQAAEKIIEYLNQ